MAEYLTIVMSIKFFPFRSIAITPLLRLGAKY